MLFSNDRLFSFAIKFYIMMQREYKEECLMYKQAMMLQKFAEEY